MTHSLSAALAATAPTMSSLEIAERTGKEHRNVMRDIRGMLTELHGAGGVLSFEHTHRNAQNGQSYPIFRLPKRECIILVTGYSIPMRAAVVDRWQELEAQVAAPAIPNFANPAEAARAWANEYEGRRAQEALRIAAQAEVEALKPAAERAHPLIHKQPAKTMWHIANWPRQSFAGRAYLSSLTRTAGALPQPKPSAHHH